MNNLITKTIITIMAMITIACSKRELPEQMLGTWKQKDNEHCMLRFEQSENGPEVYLSFIENSWHGPLEIKMIKADTATFTIREVTENTVNGTVIHQPPDVTKDIQHLMNQYGQILVRSYTGINTKGVVKAYLSNENLITDGLWSTIQNNQWDKKGNPIDAETTPLKTAFVKVGNKTE